MQSLADRSVRSLAARFAARRGVGVSVGPSLPDDVADTGLRAERREPSVRHNRKPRRKHRSSLWAGAGLFALSVLAGAAGYFTFYPDSSKGLSFRVVGDAIDRMAARNGFSVAQIALMGHRRTSDREIYRALKIAHDGSVFTYDTVAGCARVEELAWIKSCRVTRVLPDQLEVAVSERRPFAVWQRRGMFFLIDDEGRTLEPVPPRSFPKLPLVIGEGASTAAADIVRQLAVVPDVMNQLHSIERVAERRWSLNLKQGTTILLPAADAQDAVKRLAEIRDRGKILASAPRILDLRLGDRISIRPARLTNVKQAAASRTGGL